MNLEFSLRDVIPDNAVAAWGARAIITTGILDIPSDRRSVYFPDAEARDLFVAWMGDQGLPWIKVKAGRIEGNSTTPHSLDDDRFHVRCNANASHGYLYISAWMDAS